MLARLKHLITHWKGTNQRREVLRVTRSGKTKVRVCCLECGDRYWL